MWREADALTELSASGGYSRDAILPQRMFTPCGEDPQGRCNLLRRATSLARYAYLSGMRATRPAVFRVTNRRLEPVFVTWKSPTGTGGCVDVPALSSQALAASFLAPARVFVSHPPSLGVLGVVYV